MEVGVMIAAGVIHLIWIVWFAFRMNTIEDRVCKMRTELKECHEELTELRESAQAIQKMVAKATRERSGSPKKSDRTVGRREEPDSSGDEE